MKNKEKKATRKLRLNKETLRLLTPNELETVNGGLPRNITVGSNASGCCNSGLDYCASICG